jgi:hypothetical protein
LIFLGEEFQPILLDNFVDDPDNSDAEIVWSFAGDTNLKLEIEDRKAWILPPDGSWRGPETIQLQACDPEGLCDLEEVIF